MSTMRVGPYVNFQGRAREAMEFYRKVLGGQLVLEAMDEKGALRPAGPGDRIGNARLESDGVVIIGTDGHPQYPAKAGDNWAIAIEGTDKAGVTKIFNDLAEGGKVKGPLTAQPAGGEVGWLDDRFGVGWRVAVRTA